MPNFDTYHLLLETGFSNWQHLLLAILFFIGVYGSLIAGVVATWMDGGRVGVKDLWRRITKWNIGVRWYLYAFVITLSIVAIPVGILGLIGGFKPSNF